MHLIAELPPVVPQWSPAQEWHHEKGSGHRKVSWDLANPAREDLFPAPSQIDHCILRKTHARITSLNQRHSDPSLGRRSAQELLIRFATARGRHPRP